MICWSIDSWHSPNDPENRAKLAGFLSAGKVHNRGVDAKIQVEKSSKACRARCKTTRSEGAAERAGGPSRSSSFAGMFRPGSSGDPSTCFLDRRQLQIVGYEKARGDQGRPLLTRAAIKAGISSLDDRLTSAEKRRLQHGRR